MTSPAQVPPSGPRLDLTALWAMVPVHLRQRDERSGGALRALLAVIAEQIAVIEDDLDRLYDDLFIETCDGSVVPAIGELVGWRGLRSHVADGRLLRDDVAGTIAARRRKGTGSMVEDLARRILDSPARVVECFRRLATTQFMNHVRPTGAAFVDLRRTLDLERLGGPFDAACRTVDLRRIDGSAPRWNVRNVAIFTWPLESMVSGRTPATKVDIGPPARRWRFGALGVDEPLFVRPAAEHDPSHIAEPVNVPMALSRRMLLADLDDVRGGRRSASAYVSQPTVAGAIAPRSVGIALDGVPVDLGVLRVCNLSDDGAGGWIHMPVDAAAVAIDPELGRIALGPGANPARIDVLWHRGAAARIGGGEYGRDEGVDPTLAPVERVTGAATIAGALAALALAPPASAAAGLVQIDDGERRAETPVLTVGAGKRLALTAANRCRPVVELSDRLRVAGGAGGEVIIDGLWIVGGPVVVGVGGGNALRRLVLRHCTLVPGRSLRPDGAPANPDAPSLIAELPGVEVRIERCIVGAVRMHEDTELSIVDSVIDATDVNGVAIAASDGVGAAGAVSVDGCTIIGGVHATTARWLSDSIIVAEAPAGLPAPVVIARRQANCVRFSWLPAASRGPRRHRCLPSDDPRLGDDGPLARPHFVSLRFGQPGYAMLAPATSRLIRRGATDGGEMGALHHRGRAIRLDDLRERLDEYLPVGLEAGVIEVVP